MADDELPPELQARWDERERTRAATAAAPPQDAAPSSPVTPWPSATPPPLSPTAAVPATPPPTGAPPPADPPPAEPPPAEPPPADTPVDAAPALGRLAPREAIVPRPLPVTVAGIVAVAAVTFGIAALLGLGGYRAGFALVTAVAAFPVTVLAFVLLRHREGRAVLTATVLVLALVGASLVGGVSPESKGRLRARLDDLVLPGYRVLSTTSTGHSWCGPCPRVTRTWQAAENGTLAVATTATLALGRAGILGDGDLKPALAAKGGGLRVRQGALTVDVAVDRKVQDGQVFSTLTVVLRSRR